jgi:quercetin dioxygenase-like cupin family protein
MIVRTLERLSTDGERLYDRVSPWADWKFPRCDSRDPQGGTNCTTLKQLPLKGPVAGSSYLKAAQMPWQPTEDKKFWVKPLYEDVDKGEKTLLMKVDPGAFTPRHAHDDFEQFFVLEGSLFDEEQMMRAGDYVCRAPGAMHTAGSDEGAIVLLVYTKAAPTSSCAT